MDGSPVQVIDPAGSFELAIDDLSKLPEGERATTVRERMHVLTQQPFDLERGSLFRARLLRVSEQEHIAIVVMHHIVSDGWSMRRADPGAGRSCMRRLRRDGRRRLPELAGAVCGLCGVAARLAAGRGAGAAAVVLEGAAVGAPAALELPTDRPRPAMPSLSRRAIAGCDAGELTAAIERAGAPSEGATLLHGAAGGVPVVAVALERSGGRGGGLADRGPDRIAQTEGLIGFFVNTLVMRADVSEDPSFEELLARVKETALGAYAHQDIPFEKLVEQLQPQRDLSRQPLFQVMFALQNVPQEKLELAGLRLSRWSGREATAKFDLFLSCAGDSGRACGAIEYATDLFDRSTIERLPSSYFDAAGGHRRRSRSGGCRRCRCWARRSAIVLWWSGTRRRRSIRKDKCVHELFAEQAAGRRTRWRWSMKTAAELWRAGPAFEPAGASSARARGRA